SSGEQAWELFQQDNSPALAILDWTMPGMDGLELCTKIRALGREPKPYLIFVTAKARTQDIVTGLGAGADDYIVKHFEREVRRARAGAAASDQGSWPDRNPAVITRRAAADRGHFDFGWLDTSHTFAFGEYYDPRHMGVPHPARNQRGPRAARPRLPDPRTSGHGDHQLRARGRLAAPGQPRHGLGDQARRGAADERRHGRHAQRVQSLPERARAFSSDLDR